ncbi:MAG: aldo/keto reductase [Bacteroidota bacterium]
MKYLTYKNKDQMPMLGLGTWKSQPGEVYEAVKTAIEVGYCHIDCAPIYGNEAEIGEALNEVISSGIVSREELWITSKLWNGDHEPHEVKPALEKTLKDLQIEYLDLFLMHWPVALKKGSKIPLEPENFFSLEEVPISATWKAMETLVDDSLVKHIGVSNFSASKIEKLLETARIKPEMNQVESHPYLQQKELKSFCDEHGIFMTAYSPLGSGDRAPLLKSENEPQLFENQEIIKIADAKGVTPAQVLISWAINRGTVVIPKSTNPVRIQQNLESKDIELSAEEMQTIEGLELGFRFLSGDIWVGEGSPHTLESLWG